MLAAVIVLIGSILLIGALFLPWYTYDESGGGLSQNTNFYPGTPSQNGTIQYTCSGLPSCPSQGSYNSHDLNKSGTIAETGFFMIIGGLVVGILGAILGMASRGNARRVVPAIALVAIALILAIAAPVAYAAALPSAISSDSPGHPAAGPWSTFFGSNSTTIGTVSVTTTWGPGIGWYLSIVAFVLILIGVILLARARKEPPAPVAAPMSSMPDATYSASPPPPSPPM